MPQFTPSKALLRMIETGRTGELDDEFLRCSKRDLLELAWEATKYAGEDPLTGVRTRRQFEADVRRHLSRLTRAGKQAAFLIVDVDNFKLVNDTMSYEAGDGVLCAVASAILETVRPQDVAMRMGDEFFVFLQDVNAAQAVSVAERMRISVPQHAYAVPGIEKLGRDITVSVGVASTSKVGHDYDRLKKLADKAVHKAKAADRNCVRVAD